MRPIFVSAIVLVVGAGATASDTTTRVVGPQMQWTAEALRTFDSQWLHLKFVEGSDVAFDQKAGLFIDLGGVDMTAVMDVLGGAHEIKPTFSGDRERFRLYKQLGEAATGAVGPDLGLWFNVRVDDDPIVLARTMNELNQLDIVEIAHPAPVCENAAICGPSLPAFVGPVLPMLGGTPDFTSQQDYLYDTPVGLDAPSAWAETGGRGAGMKFIDVELGWEPNHEDFIGANMFYSGVNDDPTYEDHGTAVVGEVVGNSNNGYGIDGFAADAQWGTVGITVGEWPVVPEYFLEAAEALDPGDAWLIELQMFPAGLDATPMEYLQVNYDVIWTSSWAMNVVCVEAGANGSQDLDSPAFDGLFNRNVRDSGAILCGAGTPTGRVAEWFTNYGSRMDAHAWGSQIVTTGYGDLFNQGPDATQYTGGFGGTSGASPMVTGSALCLNGIANAQLGGPLTPAALRQLITDTGIPNLGSDHIGPRPDLGAAVAQLLAGGGCDGDMNGDDVVDVSDLLALIAAWGGSGGDINGDGTTDVADLLILLANFGPC